MGLIIGFVFVIIIIYYALDLKGRYEFKRIIEERERAKGNNIKVRIRDIK